MLSLSSFPRRSAPLTILFLLVLILVLTAVLCLSGCASLSDMHELFVYMRTRP